MTTDKQAAAEQIKGLYRLFVEKDCTMVEVGAAWGSLGPYALLFRAAPPDARGRAASLRRAIAFAIRSLPSREARALAKGALAPCSSFRAAMCPPRLCSLTVRLLGGPGADHGAPLRCHDAPRAAPLRCHDTPRAAPLQVNPLAETDTEVVAADAKLGFDDNAAFRQQDLFAMRDESQEDPR